MRCRSPWESILADQMSEAGAKRAKRRDIRPLARLIPFAMRHKGHALMAVFWLLLSTAASLGLTALARVQAALPGMQARRFGRVINIGTNLFQNPVVPYHDYTAVKAALALMGNDCGPTRPPSAWPLTSKQAQRLEKRGDLGLTDDLVSLSFVQNVLQVGFAALQRSLELGASLAGLSGLCESFLALLISQLWKGHGFPPIH